ncbi:MAG: TerB family tellurite resistance protein [Alphaproteobacteria bacterium]|nr:MAG: TerB family tellurite resistance protein [Alphaproteobacteria bacterium]
MIGRLIAALGRAGAPQAAPPGDGGRLALAALMVRLARADQRYTAEEAGMIDALLATRFGLGPEEAARLRAEAERLEAGAPDTVRFTRAIRELVPHEARFALVEDLWRVVLADGRRDAEEDGLMRLAANLLGVPDRDSAIARRNAARRG